MRSPCHARGCQRTSLFAHLRRLSGQPNLTTPGRSRNARADFIGHVGDHHTSAGQRPVLPVRRLGRPVIITPSSPVSCFA